MKRLFSRSLVVVATLALAAGCSSGADDSAPPGAPDRVGGGEASHGGAPLPSFDTIEGASSGATGGGAVEVEESPVGAAEPLRPRLVPRKPTKIDRIGPEYRSDTLVLKFREGAKVRRRGGKFVVDTAGRTSADTLLLERAHLTLADVERDVARVNTILADAPRAVARPMIQRPIEELERERRSSERRAGEELADLGNYYYVLVEKGLEADTLPILRELVALDGVEAAYAQPIGVGAAADLAPVTASFESNQNWQNAAPQGIDARFLRDRPGGAGNGIKAVDVETAWLLEHEDLNPTFYRSGSWIPDAASWEHGTAVLGVLGAERNAYGVTGVAPRASLGVSSPYIRGPFAWWDPAGAIDDAARNVGLGDVVLIEQHFPGPNGGASCDTSCGNCGQFAYVAVENFQAEYDVIRAATARGVIVVEAAGNGQMNLDGSQFENRFQRSVRDSGAILVGAGTSWDHTPHCWSNTGSRVDVHAWGDSVTTTGYGDVRAGGDDSKQFYTNGFSGTSSASAIVAGAVTALQGARVGSGQARLGPSEMRRLLVDTGSPQGASARNIGPQPDLRAAYMALPTSKTHVVTAANVGGHITTIDDPAFNDRPDMKLVVTSRWNAPGAGGVYDDHTVGVWFSGGRWHIYHEDGAPMPVGARFDVTSVGVTSVVAGAGNLVGGRVRLSSPIIDGRADALVQVTHDFGASGPYVQPPLVVRYEGGAYYVGKRDGTPITSGTKLNLMLSSGSVPGFVFRHTTTASNTSGHVTRLPPGFFGTTPSRVFVTVTTPGGAPIPGGHVGVWFTGEAATPVAIFDEGFRAMPIGTSFSVHYQ